MRVAIAGRPRNKLIDVAHQHPRVGEQRVDVAGGDVTEVLAAAPSSAVILRRSSTRDSALRRHRRLRLHRRQQHDVVVDFDLDLAAAQAEPATVSNCSMCTAAPVEPHLAAIVERRPLPQPAARCGGQ